MKTKYENWSELCPIIQAFTRNSNVTIISLKGEMNREKSRFSIGGIAQRWFKKR